MPCAVMTLSNIPSLLRSALVRLGLSACLLAPHRLSLLRRRFLCLRLGRRDLPSRRLQGGPDDDRENDKSTCGERVTDDRAALKQGSQERDEAFPRRRRAFLCVGSRTVVGGGSDRWRYRLFPLLRQISLKGCRYPQVFAPPRLGEQAGLNLLPLTFYEFVIRVIVNQFVFDGLQ